MLGEEFDSETSVGGQNDQLLLLYMNTDSQVLDWCFCLKGSVAIVLNDSLLIGVLKMSSLKTKPTKWHVRPAKTQPVFSLRGLILGY